MSGFVPRVEGFDLDLQGLDGYPAAISHGSLDPVIPATFGAEARDLLAGAGADVTWLETPYPHGIDPSLLPALEAFVGAALP
jgi:predicted esterase